MRNLSERGRSVDENRSQKPSPDDPAQSQRFVEMAKLLGAVEGKGAFETAISAITDKRAKSLSSNEKTTNQSQ